MDTSLYSSHQRIFSQAYHEHCARQWGMQEHLEMRTDQTAWETLQSTSVMIWSEGISTQQGC